MLLHPMHGEHSLQHQADVQDSQQLRLLHLLWKPLSLSTFMFFLYFI
jgi:hypothetical protein